MRFIIRWPSKLFLSRSPHLPDGVEGKEHSVERKDELCAGEYQIVLLTVFYHVSLSHHESGEAVLRSAAAQ